MFVDGDNSAFCSKFKNKHESSLIAKKFKNCHRRGKHNHKNYNQRTNIKRKHTARVWSKEINTVIKCDLVEECNIYNNIGYHMSISYCNIKHAHYVYKTHQSHSKYLKQNLSKLKYHEQSKQLNHNEQILLNDISQNDNINIASNIKHSKDFKLEFSIFLSNQLSTKLNIDGNTYENIVIRCIKCKLIEQDKKIYFDITYRPHDGLSFISNFQIDNTVRNIGFIDFYSDVYSSIHNWNDTYLYQLKYKRSMHFLYSICNKLWRYLSNKMIYKYRFKPCCLVDLEFRNAMYGYNIDEYQNNIYQTQTLDLLINEVVNTYYMIEIPVDVINVILYFVGYDRSEIMVINTQFTKRSSRYKKFTLKNNYEFKKPIKFEIDQELNEFENNYCNQYVTTVGIHPYVEKQTTFRHTKDTYKYPIDWRRLTRVIDNNCINETMISKNESNIIIDNDYTIYPRCDCCSKLKVIDLSAWKYWKIRNAWPNRLEPDQEMYCTKSDATLIKGRI